MTFTSHFKFRFETLPSPCRPHYEGTVEVGVNHFDTQPAEEVLEIARERARQKIKRDMCLDNVELY